MDVVNLGRQRAREERSRDFHNRLLPTAISVSLPVVDEKPTVEERSRDFHDQLLSTAFSVSLPVVDEKPTVPSVREKIAREKHERFLARLDCN